MEVNWAKVWPDSAILHNCSFTRLPKSQLLQVTLESNIHSVVPPANKSSGSQSARIRARLFQDGHSKVMGNDYVTRWPTRSGYTVQVHMPSASVGKNHLDSRPGGNTRAS
jgi:hypothetical protein